MNRRFPATFQLRQTRDARARQLQHFDVYISSLAHLDKDELIQSSSQALNRDPRHDARLDLTMRDAFVEYSGA